MSLQAQLPAPTDDVERAERDLEEHGICAVTDALAGETLRAARDDLYAAAAHDRARGREQRFAADSRWGVHLCGPVSLRPDGSTLAAWIYTASATGVVRSGYYLDRYDRDDSGRLVFALRQSTIMAPRPQDRAGG